jgi:hypothetical protein
MLARAIHRGQGCRKLQAAFLLLTTAVSAASIAHAQQPPLGKLQAEYRAETNPVKQAKLLAKLGPLDVDEASKDLQDDKDDAALGLLVGLRDDMKKTTDALFAAQPNAIKHPAGFKELQIGLRETLRRLNDVSSEVPIEKEDQLAALRTDLAGTENSLIEALFPAKDKRSKDGKAD